MEKGELLGLGCGWEPVVSDGVPRGTPHQERQVTERRKHTQFRKFVFSHIKPFG